MVWRIIALSSSGGYKVYGEEYMVEYNGDLWMKGGGVIKILCFVGSNVNLLLL